MSEAYGVLRPTAFQEKIRGLAARLPRNYFGRKAASILLGPAGGRAQRAYDVEVFGGQRARLHPFDNICEKRVYLTPQLWEAEERRFLGDIISGFGGQTFNFVDIGANVGLYSLFARAEASRAGAQFRAVAIEADPEMAERLRFNINASSAADDIAVFNCAASDAEGEIGFAVNRESRGLSRVSDAAETKLRARPLLSILDEAGFHRVDAMKIDIEGHEARTLGAFFREAPSSLRPALIIIEISHDENDSAASILEGAGYARRFSTARNALYVNPDQTPL